MAGKYTCLECGRTFDQPRRIIERHGLDSPPYEEYGGCPYCGGSYVETILCDGCGEPITDQYVKILATGEVFCPDCYIIRFLEDGL